MENISVNGLKRVAGSLERRLPAGAVIELSEKNHESLEEYVFDLMDSFMEGEAEKEVLRGVAERLQEFLPSHVVIDLVIRKGFYDLGAAGCDELVH